METQDAGLDRRYQRVALELAALDKWDYGRALHQILRLDAETLGIERVNFWLLEEQPLAIRCEAFWTRAGGAQPAGLRLQADDFPHYFAALRAEEVIAAGDARTDPRTREFADSYLEPQGIGAMMDVPVWSNGRLTGVLCHEHVGPARTWTEEETGLAVAMAQAVANTCEVRERRRAEEALHRAEQETLLAGARAAVAREQVEARDEFLSVASHELYTPLTSLQLAVDALRGARLDAAGATRGLEMVDRQVRRLTQLVSSLLDVSRIQAGRLVLDREELDLAELAREVGDRFAPLFARGNSPFAVEATEPVIGRWDRGHLDQVVSNLLSNAAKFALGRPVVLRVEARAGGARVVVADRGIGIATDQLPRIFERFERAVSSRSYGGLGLGLFIVRAIVDAHGGTLSVDSTPGEGTTLTVDLPGAPSA